MPRAGRVVLPSYQHHIVLRGHNRQVVFAAEGDYQRYLDDLRELRDIFGVKVYVFCLMTNHVHLLLAPDESVVGMGQMMKVLAACATRYRNAWNAAQEHRGKDATSLASCRRTRTAGLQPLYRTESSPGANGCAQARDYPWSSYGSQTPAGSTARPLFRKPGSTSNGFALAGLRY